MILRVGTRAEVALDSIEDPVFSRKVARVAEILDPTEEHLKHSVCRSCSVAGQFYASLAP
jgi:hypothetical protein